jgi:hypothetical protein
MAEAMGCAMDGLNALDLILFVAGTFAAALVTGLVGFAFAIVAAAVWLHFLAPSQAARSFQTETPWTIGPKATINGRTGPARRQIRNLR